MLSIVQYQTTLIYIYTYLYNIYIYVYIYVCVYTCIFFFVCAPLMVFSSFSVTSQDLWSREKQSVEPSEDDYWQVIACCERGPPEANETAQLLRQEVKERRYEARWMTLDDG